MDLVALDKTLFGPSGRFNLYRFHKLPDEIKNQIFTSEGLLHLEEEGKAICSRLTGDAKTKCETAMEKLLPRYCRCVVEVAGSELFRYGDIVHNPYAVCQASLSRSRFGQGINPYDIRSLLAVTSRRGECSTTLNVDRLPTSFLYGYAVQHLNTTKGRMVFGGRVPSLDDFLVDREHWRPLLIRLIKEYIASAHNGPAPQVYGRYQRLR